MEMIGVFVWSLDWGRRGFHGARGGNLDYESSSFLHLSRLMKHLRHFEGFSHVYMYIRLQWHSDKELKGSTLPTPFKSPSPTSIISLVLPVRYLIPILILDTM